MYQRSNGVFITLAYLMITIGVSSRPVTVLAQHRSDISQIVQQLRDNMLRFTTVRCAWTGQWRTPQQWDNHAVTKDTKVGDMVALPIEQSIIFSGYAGDRFVFKSSTFGRNGETGRLEPGGREVYNCNGIENQVMLFDNATAAQVHRVNAVKSVTLKLLELKPLILAFRILEPRMGGLEESKLRLTGEIGDKDGYSCQIVSTVDSNGRKKEEFWISPKQGFNVVRYRSLRRGGNPLHSIDISYRQNPIFGWMVSSWNTFSYTPSGEIQNHRAAEVSNIEVNVELNDSVYQARIPDGALIQDMSSSSERFLTAKNGSEQTLSANAATERYVETMRNVLPQHTSILSSSARPWRPLPWILALVVTSILLIVGLVVHRRRQSIF